MRNRKYRSFMCDFETTVYEGQEYTEVWASAVVEFYTEDVKVFHSIDETFDYFLSLNTNVNAYYHNLKFDGSFWLHYLINVLNLKQAVIHLDDNPDYFYQVEMMEDRNMENNSFKYLISDMGQWYSITIKMNDKFIVIKDSLKLLPFSVRKIGRDFKTKHQKLDMEYTGVRWAGCPITPEEQEYIMNDVLVPKEALEFMFNEGHNKLTIGSCCMAEFKTIYRKKEYEELFPDVYEYAIDGIDGYTDAGNYVKKSYKGGWCYLVKGKEKMIKKNGLTLDVNSLYPSMMHSQSGNRYPVGYPTFWKGDYIPDEAKDNKHYYFVRIKCRFKIKDGYLPFIQIKGSWLYKSTQMLTTSDIYNRREGKYYRYYIDENGVKRDSAVTLTLTMTDYILFLEHYDVYDFVILDGCYFRAFSGIFDEYIDKYKKLKMESTGAMRELAKLFLNNLYGKMASSKDSSFKFAYTKDDKSIGFYSVDEEKKKPGYIPIGSAITSYARNFTIRAAQKNYYGPDKPGFIYADTDSIHCDLPLEEIKGVTIHDTEFCCWKPEASWDIGFFVRQKTYIEHVVKANLKDCDPYNNIKCAGMPDRSKQLFNFSLTGEYDHDREYSEDEKKFLFDENGELIRRDYNDFDIGLKVPGKLLPKRIPGGVVLVETMYEMRCI